jgi:hypothetical protein
MFRNYLRNGWQPCPPHFEDAVFVINLTTLYGLHMREWLIDEVGREWKEPLWPTQPPLQWVPGVLSPGVKRGWGVALTTHPI